MTEGREAPCLSRVPLQHSLPAARPYVALLQRSPLNGYELAKASGLPRANVYSILDKLEERGAVVRLDTPTGTRYSAVPPSELVGHIGSRFSENLTAARRMLEEMAAPPEYEYVWNARGYESLLDHARTLIDSAQKRLLVATWTPEASTGTRASRYPLAWRMIPAAVVLQQLGKVR